MLGDKLCDDANVVQSTLGIRYTHYSAQKVDLAEFSGMVVALSQYGLT